MISTLFVLTQSQLPLSNSYTSIFEFKTDNYESTKMESQKHLSSNHSTLSALTKVSDGLSNEINTNKITFLVQLDFSKVFY